MNIPGNIITLLVGIILTLASLWYGQNHGLMPVAASTEASLVDGLFNTMMTIATGLFLIVQGALIFSLIKFRRKKDDNTDGPPIEGNLSLEIFWTSIPAVIVLILSVYSFEVYNTLDGLNPMEHNFAHHQTNHTEMAKMKMSGSAIAATLKDEETDENTTSSDEFVVNVTGLQFAWLFNYVDNGITSGELHLPIGKTIRLNINATDVLHAFWIPQYRLKQDAIPGRQTSLKFHPTKLGEYPIVCAELCGAYHGAMKTKVIVHEQADYDNWVTQQKEMANNSESLEKALALKDTSNAQFLAPYSQEIGVTQNVLKQIKHQ